jgi:ubiquinone/menaquinone biosynthesis C-methylase UbiE
MTALPALAAYRILAKDYDAQPNALRQLEERTLAPLLTDLNRARVIDAAAGTGRWAHFCEKRGARVVAVDFCREMLDHAKSAAVVADVIRLPFKDGCADIAICAFAIGYTGSDPSACLTELRRITRPGGSVFASDVHPGAIGRGWTRTFRSGEEVVDVAHHPYALEDLRVPGLELSLLLEPCLGPPEREFFRALGRVHRFEEAARGPAVFVARWERL